MELSDTVAGMTSPDYKERFKAEYQQLLIRYGKLDNMLLRYEAGTLDFEPTCPIDLLKHQLIIMGDYLGILKSRAAIEGIELEEA